MHNLTPWRKKYFAISSFMSSSDDIHNSNWKEAFGSKTESSESYSRTIPRHSFLIRVIVFILLEFGFTALVSAALRKPIILDLSFTNAEVKGAVTAISILWHTLAVYAVKDILLHIFSAEWLRQNGGSETLTLQELDRVSRLTAGFVDQAKHFVSERATAHFRLGFLSFLLLILLNGLGPSTIGVNLVPYDYPCTIQVANLTFGEPGYGLIGIMAATRQASSIVQVEMMQNFTTLGYSTEQHNILVPWPSSSGNTTFTFQSDVIQYNFNCSWNKPTSIPNDLPEVIVADKRWMFYSGINNILSPLMPAEYDSHIAFIFLGIATPFSYLNLDGIPTLNIPCNTTINPDGYSAPCLASVLMCNPQLEVLPATIRAVGSSLQATILSGLRSVKNIPIAAANAILSTSLLEATSREDVKQGGSFSPVLSQLFLPKVPPDVANTEPVQSIKPLALEEISQNLNHMLTSSAKAYLNGYQLDDMGSLPSFSTVNTSGIMEVQKMALVGNKPFFVATSVIVGLLVVLLGVLVAITKADQLECFELENIVRRLQLKFNYSPNSDA